MKCDIVIAGVGGQGILTIATVLGFAAIGNNFYLKQAETHGMSQRGGAVQSYLRLSDKPVRSDLIPLWKADLILSVEPM
jgi:indolepyruvate ferredoxin oxidoreductase beta subunit